MADFILPVDTRQGDSRRIAPKLLSVIAVALLVRIVFFVGYQGKDDRTYIAYAYHVAEVGSVADLDAATQWIGRIGFWLPVAGTIKLFGGPEWALVLYPLICSLAMLPVLVGLGRLTVGEQAGWVAAWLYAVTPLDVLYSTKAYSDLPQALWMLVAFTLVLFALVRERRSWLVMAGLALGLAYLHKETALLAAPAILGVLFQGRNKLLPRLGLLAAGFLAVVVIELSFWQTATGDPLHRIHAANTLVERGLARFDANPAGWIPHPATGEQYRSDNNFLDAALMFATNEEFGILYWLVWPMVVVFGAARDSKTQYLRLWIVSLALLFLFFPVKWPAHTMPRDPRYYICLTVPATLVLASFLERRGTLVRRTIIAAIVVSGLGCLYLGHEASKMSVQKELLAFQRAHSDQWLWVSPRTAADLIVLSEFTLGDRVGVHLMEQGRDSDTFRAAVSMRPALTVAADPRALREGYAVISEGTWKRPARWCAETLIRPQPSALTSVIQITLRRVGVPNRYVAKLSPSGDRTLMIFRVGQECRQASLSN